MSFDGFVTRAVTHELQSLLGGRMNKVFQPSKTELVCAIRAHGKNHFLLLSANATFARVHMTKEKYENPNEPPMFCMLLRKHLEGGIIRAITQYQTDRIITFTIEKRDELGDTKTKQLIVEIMGRHSNIILVDPTTNMVIDSIKHVRFDQSRYRTVGPGQLYKHPPAQEKQDVLTVTEKDVLKSLDFNAGKLSAQLVHSFHGLSPLVANEIVHRAGLANQTTLPKAFFDVIEPLKTHCYTPEIVGGKKAFFSVVHLAHKNGDRTHFSTTNDMLDRYYYKKAERDRVKQQAFDVERLLKQTYEKNKRKQAKLTETLTRTNEANLHQHYGELLTAHLHLVKKGASSIDVVDYYDPEGRCVTIALDPTKTAAENAQAYFKRYQKAKTARLEVTDQIQKTRIELDYLANLLQQLDVASPKDIEEIREELRDGGYMRSRSSHKKKKKSQSSHPQLESYVSSTGVPFFVGKNNRQNDYLTRHFSRQDEIWLHTKDIPGAHVLIRSTAPDEATLKEAAIVAAYFSKARHSASVPVDYTKIRYVKKPSGAKPGYVTYEKQTTLFVTPEEEKVLQLRR
ncbi:Rqc2 family fibronectin-binding protein [Shouchella lonarensis]|uniref:Rqc2 homolog RqcH n=1 Tax=Shouchella lonarensis TaxID=1464122 RepID=A0A1G6L912_9BACI|nr:NFACT RNA binding domain-containing protein [Shouchella lonarensis]SDC39026.1 Predicted component of the ribosome quality control (RQC) complex, YloA/Tae2 family, contains fibronectin-binding (FbpA) and DUF814 domains [Shouchella lonarensis]